MNPCGEYGERFDSIGSSPCDSSKAEASPTGLFRQQLRIFGKARPRGNRPKIPLRVTGTRQPRSSEHPHAAAALPAAPSAVIPSGAGSLAPAALIRSRCRMPSRVPPGGKRGGIELRLTTLLGGTAVAKLIRSRNASGVTVGGTSAGASILCEHMIAAGDEGSSVIAGSVRLAPGLGLTNRFIIDQHFRQRDRFGRLLTALAYNPFAVGIGLDEDTAVFVGSDETVEVEGSGGVTIVD